MNSISYYYFKKLSFYKIFNFILIKLSFLISYTTKKAKIWGKPISISIEPTTSCNLRCPECPSGLRSFTRPIGMLQQQVFQKTIDELAASTIQLTFYFQGEPYLNPAFLEMVQYAHKKNIFTATSTNAHYLNSEIARKTVESGLDKLIVSLDGTTQEIYEQYRIGGDIQKVYDGIKNIQFWKEKLNSPTPFVVIQFLVVKPNEHQIEEAKLIAKQLKVNDIVFKTAQIYDFENGSPLIPAQEKYSRYRKNAVGKYELKNKLLNKCWRMWSSCVITWDGDVLPCCFDKDAQNKTGNLQHQKFDTIWQNHSYQKFRNSILKSRKEIEICQNCTEGTEVFL